MIIYLFRHGQTYYSKHTIPYGEHERTAEILPEAQAPTKRIAQLLKENQVEYGLRSEFLRCEQTTKIIEDEIGLAFEPQPRLNEFTESEFNQFRDRMKQLVDMLNGLETHTVALCTHGANIAALKKILKGEAFHAHDLMYYPKTGVVVRIEGDTQTELDFND